MQGASAPLQAQCKACRGPTAGLGRQLPTAHVGLSAVRREPHVGVHCLALVLVGACAAPRLDANGRSHGGCACLVEEKLTLGCEPAGRASRGGVVTHGRRLGCGSADGQKLCQQVHRWMESKGMPCTSELRIVQCAASPAGIRVCGARGKSHHHCPCPHPKQGLQGPCIGSP